MKINFLIDHLDPMAQGVDKRHSKIAFIPKALPSEQGKAEIYKESKGVCWGKLIELKKEASERVVPECSHYDKCLSCHYLHTSYENEISYKKKVLEGIFNRFLKQEFNSLLIEVISSDSRFNYRNRIQLHYNLRRRKLGYINPIDKDIISVPNCQLPDRVISLRIKELYKNNSWVKLLGKKSRNKGHIEIYSNPEKSGEAKVSINASYAEGGFSQVNQDMNNKIKNNFNKLFKEYITNKEYEIIDLFGGSGNLTKNLQNKVWVLDRFINKNRLSLYQKGIECNLLEEGAFAKIIPQIKKEKIEIMVINPPRGGHNYIDQWVDKIRPNNIFYLSCNPMTLLRDLQKIIKDYNILEIKLFDLFPSTYHFETFVHLILK